MVHVPVVHAAGEIEPAFGTNAVAAIRKCVRDHPFPNPAIVRPLNNSRLGHFRCRNSSGTTCLRSHLLLHSTAMLSPTPHERRGHTRHHKTFLHSSSSGESV